VSRTSLLQRRRTPKEPAPSSEAGPTPAERSPALQCLSDQALLDTLGGSRSRAALHELFRRHGAAVHRLAGILMAGADPDEVDQVVEDVFVTLSRGGGRLEDCVDNVRLGLLAMAWRRARPATDSGPFPPGDGAVLARLRRLPAGQLDALALTVLGTATLTEAATVLHADRREVGARLRSAMRAAGGV
jgi:DNA-directed RNA polymerase specialized sigma24 family protein